MTSVTNFVLKSLAKSKAALDRPYMWADFRAHGPRTGEKASYRERVILREFRQCLNGNSGLVIYDVGASTGLYASALAKASAVSKIYSFEPIPAAFEALKSRTRALSKIFPINVALGDVDGESSFYVSATSASSSILPMHSNHLRYFPQTATASECKVNVRRMDTAVQELNLDPPDIIKVDVQGFEDRVIRGGHLSFRHATWCLLELSFVRLYEDAALFPEIYDLMRSAGFELAGLSEQLVSSEGEPLQINGVFRQTAKPECLDAGVSA